MRTSRSPSETARTRTAVAQEAGRVLETFGQYAYVADAGVALVDAERTTYTNGFVSFWLPRNITGTITVAADGRTGSVPFATNSDSPTCLTTLKMT